VGAIVGAGRKRDTRTTCERHTNDVDGVGGFCSRDSDEKIVRLDITVNERLVVDGLDARYLKKDMNNCNGTTECIEKERR
jgi:hypothetical protein